MVAGAAVLVLAAVMTAAIVVAAIVTVAIVTVAMVAADGVGIINEVAAEQGVHALVRITGGAGEEANLSLSQCRASAAADTAADKNIHVVVLQHTGQGTVAAANGADNFGGDNRVIFNGVNLELLAMSEMLEDLSVGISSSNFHEYKPPQNFDDYSIQE